MSVRMYWNPKDIIVYAEEHSVKECAEKYGCTYSAMQSYLCRHKIKHIEKDQKESKVHSINTAQVEQDYIKYGLT